MILFNELWNWLCLNSIVLEKVIDTNVDFKNESYNYQSIHQKKKKKRMKTIWTTLFFIKNIYKCTLIFKSMIYLIMVDFFNMKKYCSNEMTVMPMAILKIKKRIIKYKNKTVLIEFKIIVYIRTLPTSQWINKKLQIIFVIVYIV